VQAPTPQHVPAGLRPTQSPMPPSLYAFPSALAPQHLWERPQLLTPPDSRALTTSIRATAKVFEDPRSVDILDRIHMVAPSDANVLVIGETGTGQPKGMRGAAVFAPRCTQSAWTDTRLPFTRIGLRLLSESKGQLAEVRGDVRFAKPIKATVVPVQ
jgi:transcriptional regulator with AAA-type ATPase domain